MDDSEFYCSKCDKDIMKGDTYFLIFGSKYCENCIELAEETA